MLACTQQGWYSSTNSFTGDNMKRNLTIIFTILSILLIIDSFNVGESIMMFYLLGVIPGTSVAIDAALMLEFFAFIAGFTLARISSNIIAIFVSRREVRQLNTQLS